MPATVPPMVTGSSVYQITRHLLRLTFLRNILIVCLAVALLLPLYNWFYVAPAYRRLKRHALRGWKWAFPPKNVRSVSTRPARPLRQQASPLRSEFKHREAEI